MTRGERIKNRRLAIGLSVEELASRLNKNKATVYRYESNDIEDMPTSILEPLANALQTTPAYLMGWSEPAQPAQPATSYEGIFPVSVRRVPFLGEIACGQPIYADQDRESYVMTGTDIQADFCLRCKGDSMIDARIQDGDIVFVQSASMVDNGEIAVVVIDDDATLKRVYYYPEDQKLLLAPANPKYTPLMYMGEELDTVHILGRAIAFQSDL